MGFQLTSENYYSDIANYEYMSVSQFKDFAGTYGNRDVKSVRWQRSWKYKNRSNGTPGRKLRGSFL